MKLYFSINSSDQLFALRDSIEKANILYSFAYSKNLKITEVLSIANRYLILDSGAFSVWQSGKTVVLDDYISWIASLQKQVCLDDVIFINLDVIPGEFGRKPTATEVHSACEESLANYRKIRSLFPTLKIMPVYHEHDPIGYLKEYLSTDCYLLGISPANDSSTTARAVWLDTVFSRVGLKKRCHGLAVLSERLLKRFPFYSVDAATWIRAAAFGQASKFSTKEGKMMTYNYREKISALKYMNRDIVDISSKQYSARRLSFVYSLSAYEKYLTELWKKRGVVWND